jgi:hypothetical protein
MDHVLQSIIRDDTATPNYYRFTIVHEPSSIHECFTKIHSRYEVPVFPVTKPIPINTVPTRFEYTTLPPAVTPLPKYYEISFTLTVRRKQKRSPTYHQVLYEHQPSESSSASNNRNYIQIAHTSQSEPPSWINEFEYIRQEQKYSLQPNIPDGMRNKGGIL